MSLKYLVLVLFLVQLANVIKAQGNFSNSSANVSCSFYGVYSNLTGPVLGPMCNVSMANISFLTSGVASCSFINLITKLNMSLIITNFSCNPNSLNGTGGVCRLFYLNNTLAVCNVSDINGNNSMPSTPSSMQTSMPQMTTMQMTTMSTTPFVDPALLYLISNIKPTMNIVKIAQLANDTMSLMTFFDNVTADFWSKNCFITNGYYSFLESYFVMTKNKTIVTLKRIKQAVVCKKDCNFDKFISNNFSSNVQNFSKEMLSVLGPSVIPLCATTIGQNIPAPVVNGSTSATDIINSLGGAPIGSVIKSDDLRKLPPAQAVNLLNTLTTVDSDSAKALGQNVPKNTALNQVVKAVGFVPLEVINNTDSNSMASLLPSMDLTTMDSSRKSFVANKIAQSRNASLIQSVFTNGDATMASAIPLSLINSLNISLSSVSPTKLPPAYLQQETENTLNNTKLTNITDQTTLIRIVGSIKPSDIKGIIANTEITTATNLLTASNADTSPKPFTNVQRAQLLQIVVNYLIRVSGSSTPSVYLTYLNDTDASNLGELFVEASSSILSALTKLSIFSTIITKNSQIPSTRCCTFLKKARDLYASYALTYLTGGNTITGSNLDSLGICFASNIPSDQLKQLSSSDFISRISYFTGIQSQPDSTTGAVIGNLINQTFSSYTVDDLFFSKLQDASIFALTFDVLSESSLQTYGNSLLKTIKASKNTKDTSVQICRLGVGSDDYINTKYNALKKKVVSTYLILTSKRKRTADSSLTCSKITSMSEGVSSIPSSQLLTLSDIQNCFSALGQLTWTTDQLTVLAGLVKTYYNNTVANIPDDTIASLNSIITGFASTDLQQLKITSSNTVSTLGLLSSWSSEQITALITSITTNYGAIDGSKLLSMKNLACGLTDLSSISSSDFTNAMSTLKLIDNSVCPRMSVLFAKAKTTYSGTSAYSLANLKDMGSVVGGVQTSDLSYISSDAIPGISTSAFKFLSADVVNSFSSEYLQYLTSDQLNALKNSAYYSSFSSSVRSSIDSLINNNGVVTSSGIAIKSSLIFSILSLLLAFIFYF